LEHKIKGSTVMLSQQEYMCKSELARTLHGRAAMQLRCGDNLFQMSAPIISGCNGEKLLESVNRTKN